MNKPSGDSVSGGKALATGMNQPSRKADFVIVEPSRTCCDYYGRVLDPIGKLRLLAIGTRRGVDGIRPEHTQLNPLIGLVAYIGARLLPPYQGEAFRFRLLPWFDRWAKKLLQPGDNVLSSYGYANECFKYARQHGGKTFLDAGNSHMENFWQIVSEEHRRWNCSYPPVSPHWYRRSIAMLKNVDYVLCPSSYVAQSFLDRGFRREQILQNMYPADLSLFHPTSTPRPKERPLTIINTGQLSLRKGTPYLLEAFRLVRSHEPSARLLLSRNIRDDMKLILGRYGDLPIEWAPGLPHEQLAERLRSGDVFVMLSLEEGLVRTALEAMACGLQVVVTYNTGTSDFVKPGINGEVVPIRDSKAAAEAILKCWRRIQDGFVPQVGDLQTRLSSQTFANVFANQLSSLGHFSKNSD